MIVLLEVKFRGYPGHALGKSCVFVFLIVFSGSGIKVGGLDAAAPMAQVEDSCSQRDMPSGYDVGDAVSQVGVILPSYFPVPVFIQTVPPDEARSSEGDGVVCGGCVDGGVIVRVDWAGLVSWFAFWVGMRDI